MASLLGAVESTFAELGIIASERCSIRASCFDYAARKGSRLFLLKVAYRLEEIPPDFIAELASIAGCLQAAPLVVSELRNRHPLEDGVAYDRYGTSVITLRTFINMMRSGELPLVKSEPGGLFVLLDDRLLRKKREELGLSRAELASKAGTSKRAIYTYERGLARATLSVALRLQRIIGAPLIRGLNLFARLEHSYRAPDYHCDDEVLREICKRLLKLKFSVMLTKRSPFDLLLQSRDGETFFTVIIRKIERNYQDRVRVVRSISQVAISHMLIVSEEPTDLHPAITLDDFKRIDQNALLNLARAGAV